MIWTAEESRQDIREKRAARWNRQKKKSTERREQQAEQKSTRERGLTDRRLKKDEEVKNRRGRQPKI